MLIFFHKLPKPAQLNILSLGVATISMYQTSRQCFLMEHPRPLLDSYVPFQKYNSTEKNVKTNTYGIQLTTLGLSVSFHNQLTKAPVGIHFGVMKDIGHCTLTECTLACCT